MARFATLLALLASLLISPLTALAAGSSPNDAPGVDVSFPNCGQPLPTTRKDVIIVGVEGGRSFTENPCLPDEFQWAGSHSEHFEVYINTSYPAGSTIHRGDTGPKGTCADADWACKAYNYGFNNAEYAFHYAQAQFAVADTWWLDVEEANSWDPNTDLNDQVLQGAVDALRAHGVYVGVYSIPRMWKEIAGNFKINLPTWQVKIYDSDTTAKYCSPEAGFGGGSVALVQVDDQSIDKNYPCPGNAFAGQPNFVAYPLTQTQYGQLFGTHGGAATYYALSAAGHGVTQQVTLDFSPASADIANALFVAVFQGSQQLALARATDTPTPGHLVVSFTPASNDPLVVRVQTFNFERLPPISYTISPSS